MTAILVFSFVDFIAVIFTPSSSRLATFFVLASVLVSLNQESDRHIKSKDFANASFTGDQALKSSLSTESNCTEDLVVKSFLFFFPLAKLSVSRIFHNKKNVMINEIKWQEKAYDTSRTQLNVNKTKKIKENHNYL
ncbi:hypothetical protein BpHYR1_008825 [Brachionus plicatilis]|uniref:Uncharacterized protein n=1 Tax=Brachionus plicatilis TaxID=10195 RepID=A0A3M7R6H9_BRAPC|nr:hypothetical protein BpHYR1_008825 [Brachionus plicatilis]